MSELPTDAAERKRIPLCSGVLDYFPAALVEVAKLSQRGNDQHNPGEPLHWARGKSNDHLDALLRHLLERDLVGVAWRALAALQIECEGKGAPMARNATAPGRYGELIPHERAKAMLRDGVVFERVDEYVITADSPPAPFLDDDEGRTPAEAPREHAP